LILTGINRKKCGFAWPMQAKSGLHGAGNVFSAEAASKGYVF
jgi:hypothetical protein